MRSALSSRSLRIARKSVVPERLRRLAADKGIVAVAHGVLVIEQCERLEKQGFHLRLVPPCGGVQIRQIDFRHGAVGLGMPVMLQDRIRALVQRFGFIKTFQFRERGRLVIVKPRKLQIIFGQAPSHTPLRRAHTASARVRDRRTPCRSSPRSKGSLRRTPAARARACR